MSAQSDPWAAVPYALYLVTVQWQHSQQNSLNLLYYLPVAEDTGVLEVVSNLGQLFRQLLGHIR